MDKTERIDILYDAMDNLDLAIDNIRVALRGTSFESHSNAYIIPHLVSWIYSDNSFNMGIQQYIDRLKEEEDEDV